MLAMLTQHTVACHPCRECHNKNLKELMHHQFFQILSLYILRYFQTALYFRNTFSERRTLSFSDWFKLPVRARTNASRSSFANWPVMGFLGDSIPNIIVSVFISRCKDTNYSRKFHIFLEKDHIMLLKQHIMYFLRNRINHWIIGNSLIFLTNFG